MDRLTDLGISLTPRDVRCLVINEQGETVADSVRPLDGEERHNPDAWWAALKAGVADLAGSGVDFSQLRSIGLSGTPCGAVFLDTSGTVLGPAVVAGDKGAQGWCDYLEATARRSRAINGNLAKTDMLGTVLLQLREEDPETFAQVALVLSPKDYLLWRLTGCSASDPSTASASLLYDPVQGAWADRILNPLGLQRELLPEVFASYVCVGAVQGTAAVDLALPSVPVVAGASNLVATCLSLGLGRSGEGLLMLGDEAALVRLGEIFLPDPFRHIDMRAFVDRDLYFHFVDLGPAATFDTWVQGLDAGTTGDTSQRELYFLPQLEHGAVFAGLSPDTTPEDMARAVLWGAAFEITESLGAIDDLLPGGDDLVFLAPGGIGKTWGPYLASAMDQTLVFHEDNGFGAARGAALLARQSQAPVSNKLDMEKPQPTEHFQPDPDLKAHFADIQPKLAGLKSRLTHA